MFKILNPRPINTNSVAFSCKRVADIEDISSKNPMKFTIAITVTSEEVMYMKLEFTKPNSNPNTFEAK